MPDNTNFKHAKAPMSFLLMIWVGLLTSCSDTGGPDPDKSTDNGAQSKQRWYSMNQVALGKTIYNENCASCHYPEARGTFNWKKPTEDGGYPPPPLNGTAHAWHHPLPALLHTISEGGVAYGGKMPPFKAVLGDNQRKAVIAYFQSFWSDEIYTKWESLHK